MTLFKKLLLPAAPRIRERFGPTHVTADQILELQGGGCGVCGHSDRAAMIVDYNANGEARGVLCGACIAAIEYAGETFILNAPDYFRGNGEEPPTQLVALNDYIRGVS